MPGHPDFILMPYEILQDSRLNLRHIRVLMAILSWRKKNTNLARVSREILSERTGYPVQRISNVTSQLAKLGWLKKVGNGGKSQWIEYTVKTPNGDQIGNGDQNGNGDQIGNQTVTESVTQTVTETVTPIDTSVITGIDTGTRNNRRSKASTSAVPFQKIVDKWNEVAEKNGLPQTVKITNTLKGQIRQRMQDLPDMNNWENFFDYVESNDFLAGRANPGAGRSAPFRATLLWITKEGNFAKIAAREYE